jgi:hypothetical protein
VGLGSGFHWRACRQRHSRRCKTISDGFTGTTLILRDGFLPATWLHAVSDGFLLRALANGTLDDEVVPRDHGLTVKDKPFEFFAPHAVVVVTPIAPEKVVPPSGGLNTKTNTVPGCAMSAAVTAASN